MALTKPPVGTKVRFLGFHDAPESDESWSHVGEIGTVVEANPVFNEYVQSLWLDVRFENWDSANGPILLEDDSEFEVVG
jgi:hypothetical protein